MVVDRKRVHERDREREQERAGAGDSKREKNSWCVNKNSQNRLGVSKKYDIYIK